MRKLKLLALALILAGAPLARAQNYTDAYLNSVNYNSVYPCGNQGTPTVQMQQALLSVANHGGLLLETVRLASGHSPAMEAGQEQIPQSQTRSRTRFQPRPRFARCKWWGEPERSP
jgi:hypothetical protein